MTSTEHTQNQDRKAGPPDAPEERPASLDRLNVLVGEWQAEATFGAGFLGPGTPETTSRGRTTFEWLAGRYFLTQRSVNEEPIPSAISIIGVGEVPDAFVQHYHDSRGVSRDYQLTLDGRQLKIWREAPGFWQRYTGLIAEDGSTITGAWEGSPDGQAWRHDFDLVFVKSS